MALTCCGNYKPNLAHGTSRLKFKINVAKPQMKTKGNLTKLLYHLRSLANTYICMYIYVTYAATEERSLEQFNWTLPSTGNLDENIVDIFNGKLVKGGLVFQQKFLIRSYELGPDCKISIGALINLLQVIYDGNIYIYIYISNRVSRSVRGIGC